MSDPFQVDGTVDGPVCSKCATANEAGFDRCVRCGSFLPGNAQAVTTGLHRQQQPIDLRLEAEAFMAGIVVDKGGEAELSTVQKGYIAELGQLHVMLRLLVADISAHGLLSPARAPRRVFDAYLAGLDRFDRLAQRLGTKREARQVRSNLETIVHGRPADGR